MPAEAETLGRNQANLLSFKQTGAFFSHLISRCVMYGHIVIVRASNLRASRNRNKCTQLYHLLVRGFCVPTEERANRKLPSRTR